MNVLCSLMRVLVFFMNFMSCTVRTKLSLCVSAILWLPEKKLIILDDQQFDVNYSQNLLNTDRTE